MTTSSADTSKLPAGAYTFKVIVADMLGGNEAFDVDVEVFCFNKDGIGGMSNRKWSVDLNKKQSNPPVPRIEWVT